jgi:hypothetical protein
MSAQWFQTLAIAVLVTLALVLCAMPSTGLGAALATLPSEAPPVTPSAVLAAVCDSTASGGG